MYTHTHVCTSTHTHTHTPQRYGFCHKKSCPHSHNVLAVLVQQEHHARIKQMKRKRKRGTYIHYTYYKSVHMYTQHAYLTHVCCIILKLYSTLAHYCMLYYCQGKSGEFLKRPTMTVLHLSSSAAVHQSMEVSHHKMKEGRVLPNSLRPNSKQQKPD